MCTCILIIRMPYMYALYVHMCIAQVFEAVDQADNSEYREEPGGDSIATEPQRLASMGATRPKSRQTTIAKAENNGVGGLWREWGGRVAGGGDERGS